MHLPHGFEYNEAGATNPVYSRNSSIVSSIGLVVLFENALQLSFPEYNINSWSQLETTIPMYQSAAGAAVVGEL